MLPNREPPTTTVEVIAHRYSSYDTPFWARKNSWPGRWHTSEDEPTQYLSTSTDGAWAELIRREQLRTEGEVAMVSVSMWAVEVNQQLVVDYSTFELAEASGFDPDALVDDNYERCQREGTRLREMNYAGVLAPSAALPGMLNLTLFGARTASTWGHRPLLASSIPAVVITKGAPPPGLLPRVRQVGEPHQGLIAHRVAKRGRT
jgi:RES domain-containing protein